MRILFQISLLFVTLISVIESYKVYNCPSCLMPCRLSSSSPKSSLIKLFSSSIDSYTITTILNGYEGNFKISVSHNSTDHRIFSTKIFLKYWLFNTFCRILNETPIIGRVGNDTNRLSVQFRSFKLIHVNLQSREGYLTSVFFEKVGALQNELSAVTEELNKVTMQPKLKYAIYNATVTGTGWSCSNPNPMKYPTGDKLCQIPSGNWVFFELRETFKINLILFRLWDQDARVYTYNLFTSTDKSSWVHLAEGKTGKSSQEIKLDEAMDVRYIKMEGTSTSNRYLVLCSLTVDWI